MSGRMFYYKRKVSVGAKDEEGKDITKVIEVEDCFNLANAIRGHWASSELFLVMLNDGHEESKVVGTKGLEKIRERNWYISQIELYGDDIARFRKATEAIE